MTNDINSLEKNSIRPHSATEDDDREYEQTGMYPPGEKPFRIIALLGCLAGVVVFIVAASIYLDRILIQ